MTGMPQKNILMTQMPQILKNYQNDSNATIFSYHLFHRLFLKTIKMLICSPPLGILVAWHIEAQDATHLTK